MKRPQQLDRLDLSLILGVFALSLALRVGFTVGFDGLYGQDPYAYYNYGQTLRQSISQHQPLPAFFWPLGYPALLAIGFTIFGQSALTAQAISLLLGALLAPTIYVLARQLGARSSGAFVAALIMASCGQAIQSSFVVMADIPALFWALLSAILLIHYLHSDQRRWLFLAALTLAIACVTRWLYLALIPVWALTLLLTWRGLRWRETLAAGIAAALILLPQAAVSLHSPYPVLDHAWVEGWSPANYFSNEFNNVDGHFVYDQANALFYAHPYYNSYFLAPIFAPFILLGLWAIRRKRISLLILLAWALLPYLFLAGIPYQNIRFPLIVMPAVAILAGLGLEALQSAAAQRSRGLFFLPSPRLRGRGVGGEGQPQELQHIALSQRRLIFAALLIIGLALMLSADRPMLATFVANQTRDKTSVQWALDHIPAAARLYTF
ncbi:MAG: phospholipid carrier-dependent glycosyltransferase, partial [Chloroflexota bacterium]